jgi:redox-sensitive bicupin YhaK (pirin superfamily)
MFGNDENPVAKPPSWSPLSENWLRSRFHFSFAEWGSGPQGFGVLRVMNDDLVQPHRMFGPHPHADMEIATYVVKGALTHWHKDSYGGGAKETLGRGSLQFMTAGTGVVHSEGNDSDEPLRFIQMWINPRSRGLKPNYGAYRTAPASDGQRRNQWIHLCGDVANASMSPMVRLNQDCGIYASEVDPNLQLSFPLAAGRQAYVLNLEGPVTGALGGTSVDLQPYEAATATGPAELSLAAGDGGAHILIVEMAATL